MVLKSASLLIGLPHSGHSGGVSGRVSSSMVLSTSTNGTSATIPANNLPARLATAPISMPPALPPWPTMRFAPVYPASISARPDRHVVVVDFGWRRHRRIREAQIRSVEFIAAHGVQRIRRLVERDGMLVAVAEIADDDGGERVGALQPHQVTGIEFDIYDIDALAMRDQVAPIGALGRVE